MLNSIITYVVTFLIGALLTYLLSVIPKIFAQRKALMMLLQNNLTNLAFVCIDLGYIMDYQLENWCNMLGAYENLGGDGYIHALDKVIKKLPVKITDILQKS